MTPHERTSGVLRTRHRFVCAWPRRDDTGRWPVRTWLWWTWEPLPPNVATIVADILMDLRVPTRATPLHRLAFPDRASAL